MATVTCTKECYFYIDDELVSGPIYEYESGLTPGLAFTPSASKHMPDYDDSVYTEYAIIYNKTSYTTGSFTCPSSDFTVKYRFYGYSSSSTSWQLGSQLTYSNVNSTVEKYLSFGTAGYVARIKVTFASSGTATFYTVSDYDTVGYLSTVSTLDASTGKPTDPIASNDDSGSGSNFSFDYNVTAGTTYYLWIRLYNIDDTGDLTFYIDFSGASWKLGAQATYSNVSSTIEKYLSFGTAGYVARLQITFANSGTATFYTTSDYDTIGYLSTVSTLDPSTGRPTSILASDDDSGSGNNFSFEHEVTAGTTYYFWVRLYNIAGTGEVNAYIDPPRPSWKLGVTAEYSNVSSTVSRSLSFGTAGYVARLKVTFVKSGTATFYTTGDYDTIGYLSTVSTLDPSTGAPTSILASDDQSGSGNNFLFTYSVTAGTVYYFWVRLWGLDYTGSTTAYVEPPKTVKPWDWNASNGPSTAALGSDGVALTKAAYTAITSKGATSNFSYLVWNDLVDKVIEVIAATGDGWDTNNSQYLSSTSTKMSSTDKTLTAARFNTLRWNIGRHYSTGITDKSKGDIVYGSYFTTLTSALNSWIDSI